MNTPQEFLEIIEAAQCLLRSGARLALATLVRTRGSTYRRVGARMLVCDNGEVVRGLSGGCPEADIIMRAREVIDAQHARMVRYDRESGLDVLLEQGCGGELEILIEPISSLEDLQRLQMAREAISQGRSGWMACCFSDLSEGRPRRRIALMGKTGELQQAVDEMERAGRESAVVQVGDDAWLIEAFEAVTTLCVIGNNVGARCLLAHAQLLGWRAQMMLPRVGAQRPPELSAECEFVAANPQQLAATLCGHRKACVVVMTHNLNLDIECIRAFAPRKLQYLGAIGSRKRAGRLYRESGVAAPDLRAPAGLDLGEETPEAIALAIAAEIVAVLNTRSGQPLMMTDLPIHA